MYLLIRKPDIPRWNIILYYKFCEKLFILINVIVNANMFPCLYVADVLEDVQLYKIEYIFKINHFVIIEIKHDSVLI